MMIVRILSEVLVFIGPESNHWQCISTCGIITKSVSTVFWGRLLGRNWIWGSILSPHAPHHHGIVHDHLERPTSRKYNAGKIFLSTHVDNGNEDAINEAEGAWTSPISSGQSIKRRSEKKIGNGKSISLLSNKREQVLFMCRTISFFKFYLLCELC